MQELKLTKQSETVNELLARYGVKFGIYKNNTFKEQLFPFDTIPRVIDREDFSYLDRGLKQRVTALNCFVKDIYGEKKIIKDHVIPEEFVYISSGYLASCEGIVPPKGIYTHIAGIDQQRCFYGTGEAEAEYSGGGGRRGTGALTCRVFNSKMSVTYLIEK